MVGTGQGVAAKSSRKPWASGSRVLPVGLPRSRRATLLGWLVALAVVGISLLVVGTPRAAAVQHAGGTVVTVTVGSREWIDGVRPGMPVMDVWPDGAGVDVAVGEHLLGVPVHRPPPSTPIVVAFGLLLTAGLLAVAGIPGRSLALTVAAVVGAHSMLGYVSLPAAAFVVAAPVLVALLTTGPRRGAAWRVASGAAIVATLMLAGALFATDRFGHLWPAIWSAGSGVAIAVVTVVGTSHLVLAYGRWAERPARDRALGHLVADLVPAARRGRLMALEEERASTASHIHDDLLPRLAQSMRALEIGSDAPGVAVARLQALEDDLRVMIDHRQTHVLRAGGLGWALEGLAEQARAAGDECRLEVDQDGTAAPPPVQLAAYRIAQVALDNARTHARADRIEIQLTSRSTWLRVRVADDGIGIDTDAARRALGRGRIGLAELHQWANEVGGSIQITGTKGAGTEVVFRWSR